MSHDEQVPTPEPTYVNPLTKFPIGTTFQIWIQNNSEDLQQ